MNESLSNRQIMLLLFLYIVGYSIISIPKDIAQNVGTEGWITILILTCFSIFNGSIITYLGYIHKNKTIFEYSKLLTGRLFAAILVAIYIFHFWLISFSLLRLEAEYIKLEILKNTPLWAICFLLGIVALYAVTKKLRVIGRMAEVYAPIIILVYLITFFLLFSKGKFINLRPFYGSVDLKTHLNTIINPAVIIAFIGVEPLTFIPINNKNTRKIFIYVTISMMLIGFFHILSIESCLSLIGVDDVIRYYDPLIFVIRRIDLQNIEFLQRFDGIFFVTWIMSMFYILCCSMYGATIFLSKWLVKINYNFIAICVFAVSFIVALIIPTFEKSIKMVNYIVYTGLIVESLIPLILFIITKVKKYG